MQHQHPHGGVLHWLRSCSALYAFLLLVMADPDCCDEASQEALPETCTDVRLTTYIP